MSLLDPFRSRWKHSDPKVRKAAVQELTDDRQLTAVFDNDSNDEIRLLAFQRLKDEEVLARIAKSANILNLRAAERLKDRKLLADVVRTAASAEVRAFVVTKITDRTLLHRIASSDVDLKVRLCAKRRCEVPDRMRDYLHKTLSNLQVAERKGEAATEFCGNLDEVCGALIANARYRINGVTAEPWASPAGKFSVTGDIAADDPSCVEFLAGRGDALTEAEMGSAERVFYRIKIWRHGENEFNGAVEEGRFRMTSDTVAWSDSSKSSESERGG
jgi:hypothetical protein